MDQKGYGVQFSCPQQQLHHCRTNDAFVDDVTGYSNDFVAELQGVNVKSEVIRRMQADANLWNHLLHTSGGKQSLSKCLYDVLHWQWHDGTASAIPPKLIHPCISIISDGTPHNISHRDCQVSH